MTTYNTEAWKSWDPPKDGQDLHQWQAGRCAWCGLRLQLLLDHCHVTGLVRGYLCRGCNTAEGSSSQGLWRGWREGDTPALAIRHFEVYSGWGSDAGSLAFDPNAVLSYYTAAERDAWYLDAERTLRSGQWPVPPWTPQALARKTEDDAAMIAAVAAMPSAEASA